MDLVDLADQATTLLEAYRSTLLLDPFLRITVEVAETDGISQCVKDTAPLSWNAAPPYLNWQSGQMGRNRHGFSVMIKPSGHAGAFREVSTRGYSMSPFE